MSEYGLSYYRIDGRTNRTFHLVFSGPIFVDPRFCVFSSLVSSCVRVTGYGAMADIKHMAGELVATDPEVGARLHYPRKPGEPVQYFVFHTCMQQFKSMQEHLLQVGSHYIVRIIGVQEGRHLVCGVTTDNEMSVGILNRN